MKFKENDVVRVDWDGLDRSRYDSIGVVVYANSRMIRIISMPNNKTIKSSTYYAEQSSKLITKICLKSEML